MTQPDTYVNAAGQGQSCHSEPDDCWTCIEGCDMRGLGLELDTYERAIDGTDSCRVGERRAVDGTDMRS